MRRRPEGGDHLLGERTHALDEKLRGVWGSERCGPSSTARTTPWSGSSASWACTASPGEPPVADPAGERAPRLRRAPVLCYCPEPVVGRGPPRSPSRVRGLENRVQHQAHHMEGISTCGREALRGTRRRGGGQRGPAHRYQPALWPSQRLAGWAISGAAWHHVEQLAPRDVDDAGAPGAPREAAPAANWVSSRPSAAPTR